MTALRAAPGPPAGPQFTQVVPGQRTTGRRYVPSAWRRLRTLRGYVVTAPQDCSGRGGGSNVRNPPGGVTFELCAMFSRWLRMYSSVITMRL